MSYLYVDMFIELETSDLEYWVLGPSGQSIPGSLVLMPGPPSLESSKLGVSKNQGPYYRSHIGIFIPIRTPQTRQQCNSHKAQL